MPDCMMNLAGLLMLQPDLDVACSASDLAQSTTTSSSLRASARGSYNFITPELDLTASTSPRAWFKSKEHDRSVQGGDLTNLQYKRRL